MIDLIRYFKVLFFTLRVGRQRLKLFTEDHIQRLTANNPGGIFTAILTDMTNAYTAYFGDLADESLADAVLQSRTTSMEAARAAMVDFIVRGEGAVVYKWGKDSNVYQEFYPHGVMEYTEGTLSDLETISLRYLNVATSHAGDLPAGFVADFTPLRSTFMTNRTTQLNQKGVLAGERDQIRGTKLQLCTQLTKNVLTIALQYVGDEEKAILYFDQSILDRKQGEGETFDFEIDPDTMVVALTTEDEITATTKIRFENTGTTQLLVGFSEAANQKPVAPPAKLLNPGEAFQGTAVEWGFTGTHVFYNILNENTTLLGTCVVTVKP